MKNILIFCLLSLLQLALQAQSSVIGNVYFLNSKYETGTRKPAVNVQVRAEGSNGDYSKSDGGYTLRFDHHAPGKVVKMGVGNTSNLITDGEGTKLELVNLNDIESVTLPEKAADKPINIIVCPKGYRDLAAQKYYRIIKTSADVALKEKEKEMIRLQKDIDKSSSIIEEITQEFTKLKAQSDSLSIYKEALVLASINKDDASERVIKYVTLIENGVSVQEARKSLNRELAKAEGKRSLSNFKSVIEELELDASSSHIVYDYQGEIESYLSIIDLFQSLGEIANPIKIADYYMNLAASYSTNGQYEKAIEYADKCLKINLEVLKNDDVELSTIYLNVAVFYDLNGQYEKAIEHLNVCKKIREIALDSNDIKLAIVYSNIGATQIYLGEISGAIESLLKGLRIRLSNLDTNSIELAQTYGNLASAYHDLGQYNKALEYHMKSLNIREDRMDSADPILAISYNNISITYQGMQKFNEALEMQLKGLSISEKNLGQTHPQIGFLQNSIGWTYLFMKEYKNALSSFTIALDILRNSLREGHPTIGEAYINKGVSHKKLKEYKESLDCMSSGITILENNLPMSASKLINGYGYLSQLYVETNQKENAKSTIQKSIGVAFKYIKEPIKRAEVLHDAAEEYFDLEFFNDAVRVDIVADSLTLTALSEFNSNIKVFKSYLRINEHIIKSYKQLGLKKDALMQISKILSTVDKHYFGENKNRILSNFSQSAGYICHENESYSEGLKYYQKSIQYLTSDSMINYEQLGLAISWAASCCIELGRVDSAIDLALESVRYYELCGNGCLSKLKSMYFNLGFYYFEAKKTKSALDYFQKSNLLEKTHLSTIYIGLCHLDLKQYNFAIEFFNNALVLDSSFLNKQYYRFIGVAYAKNQQFQEAFSAFTEYEKLYPNEDRTFRNWAMYHALQNDPTQALSNLKKAIDLGYNDLDFLENDDSLNSIRDTAEFKAMLDKVKTAGGNK